MQTSMELSEVGDILGLLDISGLTSIMYRATDWLLLHMNTIIALDGQQIKVID
jgi:hypothetical protein